MNNLKVGGAEKALVSLLQTIDYDRFDVDLFLFEHDGMFLKSVPRQVSILPAPENYRYFEMPLGVSIKAFLKRGQIGLALSRMLFGYVYRTRKIGTQQEQFSWKYLRTAMPKLPKKYDAAIGYLEKRPNYFCIDNVDAKVKIGFIHNDYNKLQMDAGFDLPYFRKFDHIFTISQQCETILKENFPAIAHKFSIMYNIVSPAALQALAETPIDFPKRGVTLVTVGRLQPQKGFDMAVDALKILVDKGHDVYWYILGEGEQRSMLTEKTTELGLQDRFVLLGIRENPYPYVKAADIYVQPSRFEGKSIAIDEAKILAKPIVVTNFPSVIDQIEDRRNGLIVDMSPEAIASGIEALIENPSLSQTLQDNLSREKLGTEAEIEKLYHAIG
ncbi:Glycosyl transferase family 1 domain-containing protein [Flavobacterium longum]|uniref:glycosyltransferase n=1 Tax=Flavobacterium longum TaxID=1299340 RepID=UPI0039E7666D